MSKLLKYFGLGLLVVAIMVLHGCSYSTFYVPNRSTVLTPQAPGDVMISSLKTMRYQHKILGKVAVMTWGDGEDARRALQKAAAEIGANAVIDLRIEKATVRTSASGLAIYVANRQLDPNALQRLRICP